MTPQSNFMVLALILPGRVGELRQLLATMNRTTGAVDRIFRRVPERHDWGGQPAAPAG